MGGKQKRQGPAWSFGSPQSSLLPALRGVVPRRIHPEPARRKSTNSPARPPPGPEEQDVEADLDSKTCTGERLRGRP